GSAAAVASGMASGALGTDTGCSVRQPASFCGIVGFKPTYGLIDTAGVMPLAPSLDHVGPLARSVEDAALLTDALASTSGGGSLRLGDEGDRGVAGRTVGVPRGFFFEGGDADVLARVEAALEVLHRVGAETVDVELPGLPEAFQALTTIIRAEALASHADAVARRPDGISEAARLALETGRDVTALDYLRARRARSAFSGRLEDSMSAWDVLAMPTVNVPAAPVVEQPADHARLRWRNPSIFNFTGQPAISVPCGFTDAGLPVGLMIAGRRGDDRTVLQLAGAYERASGWSKRRPPFAV
ncbi:MAG: amidase, partial [Gaiellales bacterium]